MSPVTRSNIARISWSTRKDCSRITAAPSPLASKRRRISTCPLVSATFSGATKALRSSAGERATGTAADNCSASARRSIMSRCLTMLDIAFTPVGVQASIIEHHSGCRSRELAQPMPEPFRVEISAQQSTTVLVYRAAATQPVGVTLTLGHGAGAGQTTGFMTSFAVGLSARGIETITFNFLYSEQGHRLPDPND